MKSATAATLLPFALAAHVGARESAGLTYSISDVEAGCAPMDDKTYCYYFLMVSKSDNPGFGVGCQSGGESPDGALPASDKFWDCGPYTLGVSKTPNNDGGLVFLLDETRNHTTGTFTVRKDDWKLTETETDDPEKGQKWSYRDGKAFDVEVEDANSGAPSGGAATATASAAPTGSGSGSGSASASPTAAPSETSASSPSASPSDKPSGATRESAFAGVIFFAGLMALVF
ncbi:hypothetical protein PG997_008811 [Apiospora hydei]|uniref:Uncharacterized protein n=1 Tax=Apiospora hydei TaxID=1337664 RepID=A0ABR1WC32_9PEZI